MYGFLFKESLKEFIYRRPGQSPGVCIPTQSVGTRPLPGGRKAGMTGIGGILDVVVWHAVDLGLT